MMPRCFNTTTTGAQPWMFVLVLLCRALPTLCDRLLQHSITIAREENAGDGRRSPMQRSVCTMPMLVLATL